MAAPLGKGTATAITSADIARLAVEKCCESAAENAIKSGLIWWFEAPDQP